MHNRSMTFAALIEYSPDKDKVLEHRPPHRAYLGQLKSTGKLVVAGPFRDFTGGFIVYDVETEADVEPLIKNDPFYLGGVFSKWTIYPWSPVFANYAKLPEVPPA